MEMTKGNLWMVRCQLKHNSFWIWQLEELEQYVLWCSDREYRKVIEYDMGQVTVRYVILCQGCPIRQKVHRKMSKFCWMWRTGCYVTVSYQMLDNFYALWETRVATERGVLWRLNLVKISRAGKPIRWLKGEQIEVLKTTLFWTWGKWWWQIRGLLAFPPFDSAASRRKFYWKEVLFLCFFLFWLDCKQ